MTHRFRLPLLGVLAIILPLSACAKQNDAQSSPAVISTFAKPDPDASRSVGNQQLEPIANLPDFSPLVDHIGPAVVNIEAKITHKSLQRGMRGRMPDDSQLPEFFKRFFGPGFEMPDAPDPDQDEGEMDALSEGSGFIISSDGYILTNRHVVEGASAVTVKLTDRREFRAKVIGTDGPLDVALIKIDAKNLPVVRIGNSDLLKPGQWVVAIGSPFGLDHSVTAGIVSAVGRSNPYANQRYVPFIQTDVAINQGNSGGPLINTRGEVVGINSQIFSASGGFMGISFAIPINLAINAAEQIRDYGHVRRGMLGVSIGPVDALKAEALKLPDSRGALINDMPNNGAAAKAGLQIGDVIRKVNGKEVVSYSDLPPLIGMLPPGSKVHLDVIRDGRPLQVNVILAPLNERDAEQGRMPQSDGDTPSPNQSTEKLLGVQIENMSAEDGNNEGQAQVGVRITRVVAPWARELQPPLRSGLIILRIGRTPVPNVAAVQRALKNVKQGDVVMLQVSDGQTKTFIAMRAGGGS